MCLVDLIAEGNRALGLGHDPARMERAGQFLTLLSRWNRVTNLTGVLDKKSMVGLHLLDAWAIAPWLTGQHILDMGSGAGLPGIPLALMHPDKTFVLLDGNGKKTRFMTQAVIELKLDNVSVIQSRVEDYAGSFDHIVCRAFGSLAHIARVSAHLLEENGTLLAMKSAEKQPPRCDTSTLESDGRNQLRIMSTRDIQVPFIGRERHLVQLGRAGSSIWR